MDVVLSLSPRMSTYTELEWCLTPILTTVSCLVSIIGALCSVECLTYHQQRTSGSGKFTWLLSSSISFSVASVWSSQWLLASSILIRDPQNEGSSIQASSTANPFHGPPRGYFCLQFAPWALGISCVTAVLCAALGTIVCSWISMAPESLNGLKIVTAGALAVASSSGCFYLINAGTIGFQTSYELGYSIAGLVISFGIFCAVLGDVASALRRFAVSAARKTFWSFGITAATYAGRLLVLRGTKYGLHWDFDARAATKPTELFICIAAACVAFLTFFILSMEDRIISRRWRKHAYQIGVGFAAFDSAGNLMVDKKGCLPYVKITDTSTFPTILDELVVDSDLFQSLWRISHDWKSLMIFIEEIKARVQSSPFNVLHCCGHNQEPIRVWRSNTSNLFKQAFCVAAETLGRMLDLDNDQLGTLFVRPLNTGLPKSRREDSPEKVVAQTGKGIILILAQRIHKDVVKASLESKGYRFVPPERTVSAMSRWLGLRPEDLRHSLFDIRGSLSQPRLFLPNSTHVGLFALRSNVGSSQMDVLVQKPSMAYLPMVQVAHLALPPEVLDRLQPLHGKTLTQCQWLLQSMRHEDPDAESQIIAGHFLHALQELEKQVNEPWMSSAVCCSQMFKIPIYDTMAARSAARSRYTPPVASHANLLAFTIITDIHNSVLRQCNGPVVFAPLTTFANQQKVLQYPAGDEAFLSKIKEDLSVTWSSNDSDCSAPSWRSSLTQITPSADGVASGTSKDRQQSLGNTLTSRANTPTNAADLCHTPAQPARNNSGASRPLSTGFVDDLLHVAYSNFQARRYSSWTRRD